jgi:hypothetical protein
MRCRITKMRKHNDKLIMIKMIIIMNISNHRNNDEVINVNKPPKNAKKSPAKRW